MLRLATFAAESGRVATVASRKCPMRQTRRNDFFQRKISNLRHLSTVVEDASASATAASASASDKSKPMEEPQRGLMSLLTQEERDLLTQQRALMQQARELTSAVASPVALKDYNSSSFLENVVDETTFSIVVAGEFNAGKSTLINALLGAKVLESGALPTTDSITIISSSDHNNADNSGTQQQTETENQESRTEESLTENKEETIPHTQKRVQLDGSSTSTTGSGVIVHHVPNVPLLEDLTLIDTPGTNAVLADHTARTLRLLPTADLILFVTSADRPFPESEKALLASIQTYRKSIVVVVNKMDILETSGGSFGSEEKQRVVDFVTDHAADLLGGRPMVIPVSSRDALSAKIMGRRGPSSSSNDTTDNHKTNLPNNSVWDRSNFDTLESFLKDSLTMETKIKTKLLNPIGQLEGMVSASLQSVQQEQEELVLDIATIKLLHNQFAAWKKEMDVQMHDFRTDVATLLATEGNRCQVLLNRVGLWNFYMFTMADSTKLKSEFDNTRPHFSSRKSLEADLLENVQETADSIATRGRAQGQAVIEYLGKRPAVTNQSLVGSVSAASRFEDTRKVLVDKLSDAVKTHVVESDESDEEERLLGSLQQTAMIAAGLNTGALMSGLAAAAELVDMLTGAGVCSLLVVGGGVVYGQGRRRIQRDYKASWKEREERLDEALKAICAKELSRVERRILDGVAPYTRFVETEKDRLDRLSERSEDILVKAHSLRNRIGKLR